MAKGYVTGPAHIYVSSSPDPTAPGGGGSAGTYSVSSYLGTCEVSPRVRIRGEWEPLYNDISGKIPLDMLAEGEEAFLFLELNRYNEAVYAFLARRAKGFPGPGLVGGGVGGAALLAAGGAARGSSDFGDRGAMMIAEGRTHCMYVQFPYAAKPAMLGMPVGYRFPWCILEGPDELFPLGTKPRKIHLIHHALPAYNPKNQSFLLYDHNLPALIPD